MEQARTIAWTSGLEFGLADIDVHHEQLLRRCKLFEEAPPAKRQAAAARLIRFLHTFAREHFRDEEALMEGIGYPQAQVHTAKHRALLDALQEITRRFVADGPTPQLLADLEENIVRGLIAHIQLDDRQYAAFLRRRPLA